MERNRRIGVVGSGTMGSGIAQVFAQAPQPAIERNAGTNQGGDLVVQRDKLIERDGRFGRGSSHGVE